jgi:hypothetical protein
MISLSSTFTAYGSSTWLRSAPRRPRPLCSVGREAARRAQGPVVRRIVRDYVAAAVDPALALPPAKTIAQQLGR